MKRVQRLMCLAAAPLLMMIGGCDEPTAHNHAQAGEHNHSDGYAHAWEDVQRAVAVLSPTEGNTAQGRIEFHAVDGGVRLVGEIRGLNPGQQHAMHAHQWGDVSSSDGMATGGHYNPEGHDHGLPNGDDRHAGDFGNLQADENGVAQLDMTFDNITLGGPANPLVGRGLIVHAEPDDGSQPVGAAGARIAQGVIGVANPE